MNNEFFEEKCMKIIEAIVKVDYKNTRQDAIILTEKLLAAARKENKPFLVSVYERVKEEFEMASDIEYSILRRQLFS